MTSGPEQFQFAGQPDDSDEIRRLTLTANHRIRQAYYAGEAEGENRASKDPSRSLVRRDSYMGGYAAGQESERERIEGALRILDDKCCGEINLRHTDIRGWEIDNLPRFDGFYEKAIDAIFAAALTSKENDQ